MIWAIVALFVLVVLNFFANRHVNDRVNELRMDLGRFIDRNSSDHYALRDAIRASQTTSSNVALRYTELEREVDRLRVQISAEGGHHAGRINELQAAVEDIRTEMLRRDLEKAD